eukprot:4168120-Pleurochrysis_carterae.AAC.2
MFYPRNSRYLYTTVDTYRAAVGLLCSRAHVRAAPRHIHTTRVMTCTPNTVPPALLTSLNLNTALQRGSAAPAVDDEWTQCVRRGSRIPSDFILHIPYRFESGRDTG